MKRILTILTAAAAMLLLASCGNTPPPPRVTAIAAGDAHTLALKNDGTVWAWGSGGLGELGTGDTASHGTAVRVAGPYGVGHLSNMIAVAAGGAHSLALLKSGSVFAWGYNNDGQLGDGTTATRTTPVMVTGPTGKGSLGEITAVAAGAHYYSMALRKDGTVWTWGYNHFGQLGNGTTTTSLVPTEVVGPANASSLGSIVAIAAGGSHSLALAANGTVWAWGLNDYGQLGDGTTTNHVRPVQVSGLSNVTAIAAGWYFSLALKRDGTVWAWGDDQYGDLGIGSYTAKDAPVQVEGPGGTGFLDHITAIAAGDFHALAIQSNDNTLWTWGANTWGALADGTTRSHSTPEARQFLGGGDVEAAKTAVAGGVGDSFALEEDGSVWAWGSNYQGDLGDGSTADRLTPTLILVGP